MTKVLVVEDNFIIAEDLSHILEDLAYKVTDVEASYYEALESIEREKPDLCLLDITIRGQKDGIDLAETIRTKYGIPFLFITSHSDKITVERAKKTKPKGYIVKPFDQDDVYTSIEMALAKVDKEAGAKPFVLIKHRGNLQRIFIEDIAYAKADGNYIEIHTLEDKKYLNRQSLKDFLEMDYARNFCQVHKSYIVNLDQMRSFNSNEIQIGTFEIPIGKKYITELREFLSLH